MAFISSSSYSALRSLQAVNVQLDATQNRISTGLKVASAKDGAAAWSAASTLRSEVKTNETLRSGIDTYVASANVATAAAEQVVSALNDMKTAINAYGNTSNTTDQAVYLTQIAAAQQTIKTALAASKTGTADWMNSTTAISVNVGIAADGTALSQTYTPAKNLTTVLSTTVVDATDANAALTAISSTQLTTAGTPLIKTAIDNAIKDVTLFAANVGALSANLTASKDFLAKVADIKNGAISSLVDANMEEESAKLSALQVKQQLATQALSIANQSGQNVLRLFQ